MAYDCEKHCKKKRIKLLTLIGAVVGILIFLLLLSILIIWAVLRPTKPTFLLQDVTVYAFNATVPSFLTSNFLLTISSRNPNRRIGIYYEDLHVSAIYRNQQITLHTLIPRFYQGHKEVSVWSPFVSGTAVPVAPFISTALNQDRDVGALPLLVKIEGRVRWKVGNFISGRYQFHVNCPVVIKFDGCPPSGDGSIVQYNVKYQVVQRCHVSI
ncbi:NDR1/HIN1-like protein 1 [Cucurbita pepo subsp. pepo]|uniref:NDR1/HIN1-like protein 1 n=1 Tax=Cucurbita maxima TaxID=3661 RepID=A0A6J1IYC6_CUCMA|nr:NDR1/HIN1-like protein 1 [Cucurbita maxima]XP_022983107.1 NDR1/HIN1-like protein 1 [Cucurbita maxima]XP_023528057.1 NDR1/HIN1-like protein 1 [Cucurbita pepo subsp. pepo]